MALSANSVWEVRTTGSDSNGGGFVTGASGVDRSQQDAQHATLTTASTVHSTTTMINVSAGDHTVHANDIGNILQVTGGSATAGFYQVTAVDVGNNRWTMDRAVGTNGQTVAGRLGGALATPGKMGGVFANGHIAYIKSGTYSITSASTNIAGGCLSIGVAGGFVKGYQTTRSDWAARPLFQASGISTFVLLAVTAAGSNNVGVYNIDADGASLTSSRGFTIANVTLGYRLKAINCTNNGFNAQGPIFQCEASGCATQPAISVGNATIFDCYAHDNTITGISLTAVDSIAVNCISESNSGASTDGFLTADVGATMRNCVAYNNGRDGFRINWTTNAVINCIAESNTGTGISVQSNRANCLFLNNATYGNGTALSLGTGLGVISLNNVTGSGSFFVDAANGDFALNDSPVVAHVSAAQGQDFAAAAVVTVPDVVAHNTLMIAYRAGAALTTVADDKGNTWVPLDDTVDGNGNHFGHAYALNVAAGTTAITVTCAGSGFTDVMAHQAQGLALVAALDKHAVNTQANPGTGTDAVTSGSVTPTTNGQYLFDWSFDAAANTAPNAGTGWTDGGATPSTGRAAYLIQAVAGAKAGTFTETDVNSANGTGILTFKASALSGAVARAAGVGPIGQTTYIDIGAVQHLDLGTVAGAASYSRSRVVNA